MTKKLQRIATFLLTLATLELFAPPSQQTVINSSTWAETAFDSLSVDERLSQLFMIEVRPTFGQQHLAAVEKTIKEHNVGGVIFFKGNPTEQVKLTNRYQLMSKTKMLVGIDGEWGLAMRLSNTIAFPYQLGLGGIQDETIIYEMGKEIGRQCKRIGVHVNFAPVIDVNNNPNNPVINYRSFGENPKNVSTKGWAYASGLQDAGIIACAKHFPGHGDTDVDSHKDLPVINHSLERLREVEFQPFQYLIDKGIMSVMTAHLYIPAIDNQKNIAVSISDKAINGILRKEMGFSGLSFTDALNMQGVAKYHPDGELELKALLAGNDILLAPGDIPKAIELMKKAMKEGTLSEEYVWNKVRKILNYKHALGLHKWQPLNEQSVEQDLNSTRAKEINFALVEQSLCLARDDNKLVPVNPKDHKKILSIAIGDGSKTTFQQKMTTIARVETIGISKNATAAQFTALSNQIKNYDIAIVSLHQTTKYPPNYGVTATTAGFISQIGKMKNTLVVDFGNPYNLKKFDRLNSLLIAYEDQEDHQNKAAQAVFGSTTISGTLAVSIGDSYKSNMGITSKAYTKFGAVLPEEVGMTSATLQKIDKIANDAIRNGSTPGCQVLVAKNGRVVYNKSFGKHTFNSEQNVQNTDLYDLASITKVAATTISIMKLVEQGLLSLDDKMVKYLPELKGTNKEVMTIQEVLEHKAGLESWIPFYRETIQSPKIYDSVYSVVATDLHTTYLGNSLYMLDTYQKHIMQQIYDSKIASKLVYKYSDLGMILMKELIERVTKSDFHEFVNTSFYEPMGIERLTFLPLNKFKKSEIVPTSLSPDMRKGLVHGTVHDPAAAMLGGVSGHAGLFANAESLAQLMQMLLNGGTYDNVQYLKSETIAQFTRKQANDSRRGIGWDKPETNRSKVNPASDYASTKCFGHTGFTGTMTWVDPNYNLVYVFLSNRVYPSQENKKLIRSGVRTSIMDVIYESFLQP